MTLSEFLAQNPSANSELDRIKAEARTAGREEAQTQHKAVVAKCMTVLGGDAYPVQIREIAGKVLTGESHEAALESAIAVYDAGKEAAASAAAKAEPEGLAGLSGAAPAGKNAGEKELDAAIKAELDKRRAK